MGEHEREGIYVISVIGSTIRLLRDNARAAAVSHDGTKIAFVDPDFKQISVMDIDGQQVRPLVAAEPGYVVLHPKWSNDGRRISYVKGRPNADVMEWTLLTCAPDGTGSVPLFTTDNTVGYDWTPDGRLILARTEPPPRRIDSNLWEIRVDTRTGQPKGEIRRLTDWTGFNFVGLNLTADGKQLVFTNYRPQSDVFMGEAEAAGQSMKTAERLTLDERLDWPSGWTRDGKAVLFYSDRAGAFNLYRQSLGARTPEAVVINAEQKWSPQLSPDGAWILYMSRADRKVPVRLMRLPAAGGAPELLFELKGAVDFANDPDIASTDESFPSFHCGKQPGTGCIVAERLGDKLVFSSFDPAQGRNKEAFTMPVKRAWQHNWDFSPDGTRLAVNTWERDKSNLQIVTVADGKATSVVLKDAVRLGRVAWAADGAGWYLISYSSRGNSVVFATLDGKTRLVYTTPWDLYSALPSPDGRHVAMGMITTNANVWKIAEFPKQ